MRYAVLVAIAGLTALWVWFMRDPERTGPCDPELVLSPADGHILAIEKTAAPRSVEGMVWRMIIFLALSDVHVQRAPVSGRIVCSAEQRGAHWPAFAKAAVANQGHWLDIESDHGRVMILRTAGLLARRVTTTVHLGETVATGQRIGRILFGSRTEVYLPITAQPMVQVGQHVRAGETSIARWMVGPLAPHATQVTD